VAYPRMSFGSPGIVLGDLQRGAPNRARTGDTGIPLVESLACYLFRIVYYSSKRESSSEWPIPAQFSSAGKQATATRPSFR
jgi:hypothetical protein